MTHRHIPESQRGIALFTALIILVALTLVSLGSLGTSILELRMSTNEESRIGAFQSAQSAIDAVIKNSDVNYVATGTPGNTKCYNWPSACNTSDIILPSPMGAANQVKIEQTAEQGCPPRTRLTASSCTSMNSAPFTTYSTYDGLTLGRGKSELVQGWITLVPVGGQGGGSAPVTATHN